MLLQLLLILSHEGSHFTGSAKPFYPFGNGGTLQRFQLDCSSSMMAPSVIENDEIWWQFGDIQLDNLTISPRGLSQPGFYF
jgi:hypothetical protein